MNDKLLQITSGILEKKGKKKAIPYTNFNRAGVTILLDKPYQTRDGETLSMDIFLPEGSEQDKPGDKLPLVIAIHGGGFFMGDKKFYYPAGQDMASRGYAFCSVSYRLLPNVRVYEQMLDICAGMDSVVDYLEPYRIDYDRVYVMSESAGSYFATYVSALEHSKVLQQVIGCEPSKLKIKSMVLEFGMFYSNKFDIVKFITPSMYGRDDKARKMKPYMNPEHPEVIKHFPPSLLVTSDADFLKKYSYNYSKALTSHGIENTIVNMGSDKKLSHAFNVMHPEYKESKMIIDIADKWFSEH